MITSHIIAVIFQFLGSFFSGSDQYLSPVQVYLTPNYRCTEVVWEKQPTLLNGLVVGTLQSACDFESLSGGGFPELDTYLQKRVETHAESIQSGPTNETFMGYPSTFYDATFKAQTKNDSGTIRGDIHIATDSNTILLVDLKSTKIDATGYAGYIKKAIVNGSVIPTQPVQLVTGDWYQINLHASFEVEKPWYVPLDMFISEVERQLKERAPEAQQKFVEDISQHI